MAMKAKIFLVLPQASQLRPWIPLATQYRTNVSEVSKKERKVMVENSD
jgi:hypothetical protein